MKKIPISVKKTARKITPALELLELFYFYF